MYTRVDNEGSKMFVRVVKEINMLQMDDIVPDLTGIRSLFTMAEIIQKLRGKIAIKCSRRSPDGAFP
jgi:hypothetical protein